MSVIWSYLFKRVIHNYHKTITVVTSSILITIYNYQIFVCGSFNIVSLRETKCQYKLVDVYIAHVAKVSRLLNKHIPLNFCCLYCYGTTGVIFIKSWLDLVWFDHILTDNTEWNIKTTTQSLSLNRASSIRTVYHVLFIISDRFVAAVLS